MKQTLRFFLLLSITALLAGCKLAVIVVEGGTVESIRSGTCVVGSICIVDVDDPYFADTFTTVPEEGWYFHKWNSGHGFFCGGSTDSTCTLSFQGHEESKAVEVMTASSETFYLMPVFKPYKDMITVDGKEWLQPKLFLNLSWKDINAVCPEGVCAGVLNEINMNGWTWASFDDINALFNYYIGSRVLRAGEANFMEAESEWAPAFYSDGWLPTDVDDLPRLKAVEGWLRHASDDQTNYFAFILYVVGPAFEYYDSDRILISTNDERAPTAEDRGGWFYRTP
jgi:hypothetical protein